MVEKGSAWEHGMIGSRGCVYSGVTVTYTGTDGRGGFAWPIQRRSLCGWGMRKCDVTRGAAVCIGCSGMGGKGVGKSIWTVTWSVCQGAQSNFGLFHGSPRTE